MSRKKKVAPECGHLTWELRKGWCTQCFKAMKKESIGELPFYLRSDACHLADEETMTPFRYTKRLRHLQ